jgi:Ca-activated chloride channel family protein
MDIKRLNNISNVEKDPSVLFESIAIILAILTGILLCSLKFNLISVSSDFFETIPEERCAKLVHEEVHGPTNIKKSRKFSECSTARFQGGGGDPRARVAKQGVLDIISGQIKGKSVASADIFGKGGFSTDFNDILSGVGGLKSGGSGAIGRKGAAGIGYGAGYGSGFGGSGAGGIDDLIGDLMSGDGGGTGYEESSLSGFDKHSSITYSPSAIQKSNPESVEGENPFTYTTSVSLSTFSIDVDNASYTTLINYVRQNILPPPNSIRIEEMINNFSYDYPVPSGSHPLSVVTEVSGCPWDVTHRILRIGIKGRRLPPEGPPPSNFVFLVDVSGSMGVSGKLPLFKQGLRQFVSNLHNQDRISIITYAGEAGLHLASTPGDNTALINNAIDRLNAGGSTAGSEGIQLAYRLANSNFISNGNNRIILVTDGNFNVGESNENALVKMIEKKRGNGIFLTIIGMNVENDEDEKTMERLANNGDGNFSTVFNEENLHSVLFSMSETFFTVAKDVKIQVQFNPERVEAYRLLGYENRMLQSVDFADDTKDAGEIGAEQCVTALYEIALIKLSDAHQLFSTVNIRYKDGTSEVSKLMTSDVYDRNKPIEMSSVDFRFATAVAGMGLLLINSSYRGTCTYDAVIDLASSAASGPYSSQRYGFIDLAQKCKSLAQNKLLSTLQ